LNRHEFLTALHAVIKPKVYLEIGVQTGASLKLAHAAETAIGIDPHPQCSPSGNQVIFAMESDEYFRSCEVPGPIDLAFIDGMHLVEYAMRDFSNVERNSWPSSIVVFDDVLPYSSAIATREQPPGGDWTGDVWKCYYLLKTIRPDLRVTLVDTKPTGTMVVSNLDPINRTDLLRITWGTDTDVPDEILSRSLAVHPLVAIYDIQERFDS
jgi:hypothetical protein